MSLELQNLSFYAIFCHLQLLYKIEIPESVLESFREEFDEEIPFEGGMTFDERLCALKSNLG